MMIDKSSRASEQTAIRLTSDLRQWLAEAAKANHRTISEEMRVRLQASFSAEPPSETDPQFRDVLSALHRAAQTAGPVGAKLKAPAYRVFEEAAAIVIEAMRPPDDRPLRQDEEWLVMSAAVGAVTMLHGGLIPKVIELGQQKMGWGKSEATGDRDEPWPGSITSAPIRGDKS